MQLTVREVAHALKVPEKTVYQWISDGSLPAQQVRGNYRLNRADLIEWATANQWVLPAELLQGGDDGHRIGLAEAIINGGILRDIEGNSQESVLRSVVARLSLPEHFDREVLLQVFLARERLGSTAIGDGLAIPHARSPILLNVKQPSVSVCFLATPIEFGAPDGRPVDTLCLLITPALRDHLHLLSSLAYALRDGSVRLALRTRAADEKILDALRLAETALRTRARDSSFFAGPSRENS